MSVVKSLYIDSDIKDVYTANVLVKRYKDHIDVEDLLEFLNKYRANYFQQPNEDLSTNTFMSGNIIPHNDKINIVQSHHILKSVVELDERIRNFAIQYCYIDIR